MNCAALPLVIVLMLPPVASAQDASPEKTIAAPAKVEDFAGAWDGEVTHRGESTRFAVELEPAADGTLTLKATVPVAHAFRVPFVTAKPELAGDELRLGPFAFTLDRSAGTLRGTIPEGLAPVYQLPFVLRRVAAVETPARPAPSAPLAKPAWTYEAGAAQWAGPTFSAGVLYFGGEDGAVHALDARSGHKRWSFRAGGPIRTRPTIADGSVYVAADDGCIYALQADTGQQRWRVKVVQKPIVRLPFDDPKSRYDRFGADVTVADGRVFVGTHDGRVVALSPETGRELWEFATSDSVLGAPALVAGRLFAGSFDGHVYALDAASGRLLWKRDTRGAVVSTPAVHGGRLIVGNRSYDLLGLDAATGEVAWSRYVWFSWVESSATIVGSATYVGSSDAAAVLAFDAARGRPLWKADVYGWAWGQPAVAGDRVYAGTSCTPGYMGGLHKGGAVALERATGRMLWRFEATPPSAEAKPPATYGFPGSPATGDGLVFFAGLDGRVYAFVQ